MKREDILRLFEIFKKVENDLNVVYAYLKLEPICDDIDKFRQGTIKKLAKSNHDDIVNRLNNNEVLTKDELDYINKFGEDFNELWDKYMNEVVEIELPNIDGLKIVENNKLSVPESALILKLFSNDKV